MQKLLILLVTLSLSKGILSQNVGVGTNTPAQKLDVAGNINTSGNLMVNGVAGTNGQVLTMNGSTMQWMDKSRFKNWSIYHTTGGATFTVPAGVTEVLIEMWGAGGGGHNPGGGGGSGGYFIGIVPVAGITTINLTIGDGGNGGNGTTAPLPGTFSRFTCTGFSITANGGNPGDSSHSGPSVDYIGGTGGGVAISAPSGYRNYFMYAGNSGVASQESVIQVSSTGFNPLYIAGTGGIAPFSGQASNPPAYQFNSASGLRNSSSGINVGNGFGSGGNTTFRSAFGNNGFDGRILIYY